MRAVRATARLGIAPGSLAIHVILPASVGSTTGR